MTGGEQSAFIALGFAIIAAIVVAFIVRAEAKHARNR